MKPAQFDFVRARTLTEACQLLIEAEGSARLVAGGQSLGPMLNLRLAQPRVLIDITGIRDLTRIEDTDEAVALGACITTANIEDGRFPRRGLEMLPIIASQIAFRAVRNRGTIGGSVCHADPASDWVSALCAFGAECLLAGVKRKRLLPVEQFVTGAYQNALEPGEILDAIRIPRVSPRGRYGYYKLTRKAGEFALAIGAVLNDPDRGQFRAAIGATRGAPIVLSEAHSLQGTNRTIDETAVLRLLDKHGICDRIVRRLKLAALTRAYVQAITS
jgi:aerobic carbon-monoxide dehydrogenase medium subunit